MTHSLTTAGRPPANLPEGGQMDNEATRPEETEQPYTSYSARLKARGSALRVAYTSDMTKPEHRSTDSALVSILVDVILTLKVQGRTIEEIVTEAQAIAETEWYFAEAQIRGGE